MKKKILSILAVVSAGAITVSADIFWDDYPNTSSTPAALGGARGISASQNNGGDGVAIASTQYIFPGLDLKLNYTAPNPPNQSVGQTYKWNIDYGIPSGVGLNLNMFALTDNRLYFGIRNTSILPPLVGEQDYKVTLSMWDTTGAGQTKQWAGLTGPNMNLDTTALSWNTIDVTHIRNIDIEVFFDVTNPANFVTYAGDITVDHFGTKPVPEPASFLMAGLTASGLGALAFRRYRRAV